jgi:hypothetical protein
MKRFTPLVILAVLAGCASGGAVPQGLIAPELEMYQVGDYSFSLQYSGVQSVGFEVAVTNPSAEPMVLRQIKFTTIGTGAYYVDQQPQFFNLEIPARKRAVKGFSLRVYAQGGSLGSREPVNLRAVAQFESAKGKFQRVFFQRLNPADG